jgi:hypothetical protein
MFSNHFNNAAPNSMEVKQKEPAVHWHQKWTKTAKMEWLGIEPRTFSTQ